MQIPKTKSNVGKISNDSSKVFSLYVAETTIDDYNNYVKDCEEKGFTEEYKKYEHSYEAKNSEGYKLRLYYRSGNVVSIDVYAPEEPKEEQKVEEQKQEEPISQPEPTKEEEVKQEETKQEETKPAESTTSSNSNSTLRPEFKSAMDSYEKFMNEYVDLMKKYQNWDGSDMSIFNDYSKYISQYSDVCSKFEKWESESMNDAETKYYIEVQTRVNKKLSEIS